MRPSTPGRAGLIVVYETNLADQIAANIKAANRIVLQGHRHGRLPAPRPT